MRLTRVDDPRDSLEKANRDELWKYARAKGVKEIDDNMFNGGYAAERMRRILRQKGLTDINIPYHQLGLSRATAVEQPSGNPAMKYEDLINEQPKEVIKKVEDLTQQPNPSIQEQKIIVAQNLVMHELRKACKSRGIHMDRTDNKRTLQEKLDKWLSNGKTVA